MACYHADWPALVLCPASLRDAWAAALVTWLPEALRPATGVIVVAQGKDIAGALARVGRRDIVIVPYSLVAKASDALLAAQFGIVVADESHCLKDGKAQRTRGAAPLLRSARRAICLTGTPALSRPVELYPQLSCLQPRVFPSFNDYAARFCAGGRFGMAQGCSNSGELHAAIGSVLLVRRLKKDVLTQLPPKVRSRIALPVAPSRALGAVRAALAEAQKEVKNGNEAARADERRLMTQLYTDSAAYKAPAAADYLSTLVDGAASDAKFLFFAHHTCMLDTVAARMVADKVPFMRIDGATPVGERACLVERFQRDERVRVALLSIKAAGVGLTLTAASTVVFGELSWTPGDIVQAEDRAHRIGQAACVAVHILTAPACVDEYMWNAIQHKLDKLGNVLDGAPDALHVAKNVELQPPPEEGGGDEGGGGGGGSGDGSGSGGGGGGKGTIKSFFARAPLAPLRNDGEAGAPAEAGGAAGGASGWDDAWGDDAWAAGTQSQRTAAAAAAAAAAGAAAGAPGAVAAGALDGGGAAKRAREDDWGDGW
jgi:SWI/SNF-related matrix-associated actin-dependent regulator 1 of chromatin subfamily A